MKIFCPMCGEVSDLRARFCSHCGNEIASGPLSISDARSSATGQPLLGGRQRFAGFWVRTLAHGVDWVLIGLAAFVILLMFAIAAGRNMSPEEMEAVGAGIGQLFATIVAWLYFTVSESSTWQATPGKKLLGLRVVDPTGSRIGWWRANGRYWSKILSAVLLWVGFLMVGFTGHKQGLHDMMARTFVIRTDA